MNTRILTVGLVIASIAGFYFFTRVQSQDTSSPTPTIEQTKIESQKSETLPSENLASRYVPYSRSVLDQSTSGRRVLYFYANWCSTCRPADESFQKNSDAIPTDVTVIRVNYNDNDTDADEKSLATKYGITYQHTFVQIDSENRDITKWNGGALDELIARIK